MHDVIIIGAGPAGLYAASELSSSGFDVVVLEEHAAVGQPVHCTGILGTEAYREFDLPQQAILNELRTARFYSPGGQSFDYRTERVEVLVVDRKVFDEVLSRKAQAAGCAMLVQQRVSRIEADLHEVRVRFHGVAGSLRARACILACGANYTLQRMLGMGIPSAFLQSAQAELPAESAGDLEIHFGSKVAARGFAWVVPVNRGGQKYARVGLMCDRSASVHFQTFVESVSSRWGIAKIPAPAGSRKILPLGPIQRTFGERLLVVGDAAGIVKPTTGGGIYYSILSAALAVEVLTDSLRHNRLAASDMAKYEKLWRARLGLELKAQLAFRNHGQALTDSAIEQLFDLVRTDGIIPLVRKTATFNRHRQLILSLFQHNVFRKIFVRSSAKTCQLGD